LRYAQSRGFERVGVESEVCGRSNFKGRAAVSKNRLAHPVELSDVKSDGLKASGLARGKPVMNSDDRDFHGGNTHYDRDTFEKRFSKVTARLKVQIEPNELLLLRRACFGAFLCNATFNGLGGRQGEMPRESEFCRILLEQTFTGSREQLYGCRGWQRLPSRTRKQIERAFLRVEINEDNLAH
jgi:hypothetical protein